MPFKHASMRERLLANSKAMRLHEVDPAQRWTQVPCRIWIGALTNAGYAKLAMRSRYRDKRTGHRKLKTVSAHRASLAEHLGLPPWALNHVLHLCDNKPCIEPAHLFSSTQLRNMRDMVRRGRARNGATGPLRSKRESRAT